MNNIWKFKFFFADKADWADKDGDQTFKKRFKKWKLKKVLKLKVIVTRPSPRDASAKCVIHKQNK